MDKCKHFKVVDNYERTGCIGYADTLEKAIQIKGQQEYDTDGECDVVIKELQPQGGYKAIKEQK